MTRKPVNLPGSVATRLRSIATARQTDLALIYRRYAIERLLYRLSVSPQRDRFVLKGAMLFTAWLPDPFRPTQDLDLLGFGDAEVASVADAMATVCAVAVPEDGLTFDAGTLKAEAIRAMQSYGGVRVRMTAQLGRIRIPVQIDIGFGDVVTPAIHELEFPVLLDAPAPLIRAYPKETVLAEKLEAIVALGVITTRMKDYYDLLALARLFEFDGDTVRDAILATFARRQTALPHGIPPGLTEMVTSDPQKIALWQSFIGREPLLIHPGDLVAAVEDIAAFVMPPLLAAAKGKAFRKRWQPSGPWKARRKTQRA